MTTVASWSPVDYHTAFDGCRRAWERTQPQLVIDGWADALDTIPLTPRRTVHALLEEAAGTGDSVEPVLPPPTQSLPGVGGLGSTLVAGEVGALGVAPPPTTEGRLTCRLPISESSAPAASVDTTTTGGGANPQPEKRAASQKGA